MKIKDRLHLTDLIFDDQISGENLPIISNARGKQD